jgi:hypothetical protein
MNDNPIPDDELDPIRDCRRPAGFFLLDPCPGCGTPPVWVGGDAPEGGYVQDHTATCPVAERIRADHHGA